MKITIQLTSALALGTLALACSKEAPPPETPASQEAPADEASEPEGKETDDPTQSDINIAEEIRTACGLSDSEAHFAYASANVRDSDKEILTKIADCFTTGPLKGRTMNLVGHADPRGEPEYNIVLGGKRADNVADALIGVGLPEAQVTTTSQGEIHATGTDESSWAKDRRVDINLAEAE